MKSHQSDTSPLTSARCYERIAKREETVGAFQYLKPEPQALTEQDQAPDGCLKGMPIGIKDIYDTIDMPTRWGTTYLHAPRSLTDASLVAALRQAGAIPIGKTISTEMAYFTPGKTRNPHDLMRTPGGSSSGSAAAVADGMVQAAIGSQTAGSIIRPASFCGVVGFKPSAGIVPTAGVMAFSKTLDTVGWFTSSVDDSIRLFNAATQRHDTSVPSCPISEWRINWLIDIEGISLNGDVRSLMTESHRRLDDMAGKTQVLAGGTDFQELVDCQKAIMAYEASRTLVHEFERYREEMSQELVEIILQGRAIDLPDYLDAIAYRNHSIEQLENTFFADADVLIAPSTIGEATAGLSTTGDPVYCRPWTLLGLPCLHLPIGQGDHGMPIGIQLIGRPGKDLSLLSIGKTIAQLDEFTLTCSGGVLF
ncbi:amidase [Halomonas sp. DQ26W]|uniref:amidase n=1 Tax=Halomonas sp. DQ26W TaxID=2282311 RepID=UPI000DF78E18|nr:amidase [Halomonas sp. DQ26W]RDB43821.1 amidase [Halomonas sp. DQ26W]